MKNLSAEELKKYMASEKNIKVVNVLDKEFYDDCHIKDSINISMKELEDAVKDWDKDTFIVSHCASYDCPASGEAADKLKELGFTNVYTYEGGVKEWKEKGFDCIGKCQKEYITK